MPLGEWKANTRGTTDLVESDIMGGRIKKTSTIISALIIALSLVGLVSQSVWADPTVPTNLQFESTKVFHNLIEDDDFLLVLHYNIHYNTDQPDTPANKLFTFRLLDTDGIDYLGSVVPYAYYNSGYDQGCAAFYFPKDEAPDWEGAYIVRISGNPEYWSTPPLTSHTLTLSDYSQLETQAENQTLLGNYVLDIALDLEINWSTTLLYNADLGVVLNSTGETYFRGAIPGLQAMAPQLFAVQTTTPQYTEEGWTQAQGNAYGQRFAGTWVQKSLDTIGDMFSIKWNVIPGMIIFGVIIAMAIWCQMKYGNIKPVPIAGDILIVGGTVLGWMAPAIMAISTIFLVLFTGYVWFFRHG